VSAALAPPFLVACVVLCAAGALKLRSPRAAGDALRTLGLPGAAWIVRAGAAGEITLGAWSVLHPERAEAVLVAAIYALFAASAVLLARWRAPCGCFGEERTPVSAGHVLLSGALAALSAAAAVTSPRGVTWLVNRSSGAVVAVGITGAAYAVVLLYTEVPRAWASWSGK
jgi:hypothetical protein